MKYIDEYREPEMCRMLLERIRAAASRPWVLMDVCGGQTHGLVKSGIEQELSGVVELIHGPGCPVCVTPVRMIDFSIHLSMELGVTVVTFGDMLRVPGSEQSLMQARARGGHVQIVYSPLDAVRLAKQSPEQHFVLFAVGFETTAPATGLAVLQAVELGLDNFSLVVAHVRVQPAMEAIMRMPDNRVQAFLAAGHVSTVTGLEELDTFASQFSVPIAITGFEPIDLLNGILACVEQLESSQFSVMNRYGRNVNRSGNRTAQTLIDRVYEVTTRTWRGFGEIEHGGLQLRSEFARFDALRRFGYSALEGETQACDCRAGDVMAGRIKPVQCPAFGTVCTPLTPLGAPMISSEGACAAYYRFCKPVD